MFNSMGIFDYIVVHPLKQRVDYQLFARIDVATQLWHIHHPVRMIFEGVKFNSTSGDLWRAYRDTLEADDGFTWDGVSGPTFDSAVTVLAGLTHDIVCTKGNNGRPLPYFKRHWLYHRVASAQGMSNWRSIPHWLALVSQNWWWSIIDEPRKK